MPKGRGQCRRKSHVQSFQLYICLQICFKDASFPIPVTFSSWHCECDRCVCVRERDYMFAFKWIHRWAPPPPLQPLYTLHLGLMIRLGVLEIFIYISLQSNSQSKFSWVGWLFSWYMHRASLCWLEKSEDVGVSFKKTEDTRKKKEKEKKKKKNKEKI